MPKGFLVAFEGIDGSGKTTLASRVDELLQEQGWSTFFVGSGCMPSESIVMQIKSITHNPDNCHMCHTTETFLYLASLAQRTEEYIIPHLEKGKVVLADRFTMSVFVLAHYARHLPRDIVSRMVCLATRELTPNLTLLCDIEVSEAEKRKKSASSTSRKEREGAELMKTLREGYLQEAKLLGNKCFVLRSDKLSISEMSSTAVEIIMNHLSIRRCLK